MEMYYKYRTKAIVSSRLANNVRSSHQRNYHHFTIYWSIDPVISKAIVSLCLPKIQRLVSNIRQSREDPRLEFNRGYVILHTLDPDGRPKVTNQLN